MKNILVIGESSWIKKNNINFYCEKEFSKINILHRDNELLYLNSDFKFVKIDGIIWRGQFDVDSELERYLLEVINVSSLPCINDANVMLNFGSNIAMYNATLKYGLPVIEKDISFGNSSLDFYTPKLPCVIKVGNYHMGYGKALIQTKETWQDSLDLTVISNKTISVERYIKYVKDIRCLLIGDDMFCVERVPSLWKANVFPKNVKKCTAPKKVLDDTYKFSKSIGADIMGLDWIEDSDGKWYVLEGNLSPGLDMIDPNQEANMSSVTDLLMKRL